MLIVCRPGGFDLHDPAVWARFVRIRNTVGAKAWTQTDGWSDDRAVPGLSASVGLEGRRLRRGLPRWVWVGIGIAAAAVLVPVGVLITVFSALSSG
ncbi:hypothetical protein [uncultured Microbacterium sp.]|uniref:hypothetical protein n=1 Tax=uncultured Microbacterium sp. TaxID=191216 RepID=UPI0025E348E3|nr:hypothetical protein [uncultured Microbacterium sp.]